jgi:D-alanine-D-alanine ligase
MFVLNKNLNKTILVICGGYSTEREVSIKTGNNVLQSLERIGYKSEILILESQKEKVLPQIIEAISKEKYDLVFNALHGEFGEDGQLQAILQILDIPFTGSGILASSLGMDKARLYDILDNYNIRIPKTISINKEEYNKNKDFNSQLDSLKNQIQLPFIIKPNDGGSSIGVTKVSSWDMFDKGMEYALQSSQIAIIQEFIEGVEITCPVLDNLALPVGEIQVDTSNTFFDYEAKYNSNLTQEIFPARLDKEVLEQTQKLAQKVHKIIGACGLTRSDFIYNVKTKEVVFLEINTSPGMTNASLCPKSAKCYGWSFDELVQNIVSSLDRLKS